MSSSLFYDCYAPYETYPTTIHVDGDKSFGEIKNGDVLYMLICDYKGYRFKELDVVYEWHQARGYNYISCLKGKKNYNINFGPVSCGNCSYDSKGNSIVCYKDNIIGTNKESIYNYMLEKLEKELAEATSVCDNKKHNIELLKSISK